MEDFLGYRIRFSATDEALSEVAKLAANEKTGARGLLTILERTLREYKFELPSTPIRSLKMTKEMVENPEASLVEMLKNENRAQ